MKNPTRDLALTALFTALTCVLAQFAFPLPFTQVPISLATLATYLAGACLGAKRGALSQLVYVLLGACGAPVFAGATAGFAAVVGPTGGYMLGYVLGAAVIGAIVKRAPTLLGYVAAMVAGTIAVYAPGVAWMMATTGMGVGAAVLGGVVPFLPGDAFKAVVTVCAAVPLRMALKRMGATA